MYQQHDARLGLAEYLTALQAELHRANAQGEEQHLPFGMDGVTLEIEISFTLERSSESRAAATPEFWVAGAVAQENSLSAQVPLRSTQHLVVRLSPRAAAEDTVPPEENARSVLPRTRVAD